MTTTIDRDAIINSIISEPRQAIHWLALADVKEEQGECAREERWLASRLQTDHSPLVVRTSWARSIRKAVNHKGRKPMRLKPGTSTSLYGDYWEGGSREEWYTLDLKTGAVRRLRGQQWNEGPSELAIQPGLVVIQVGWFCGKRATPIVHCHPLDLPQLSA